MDFNLPGNTVPGYSVTINEDGLSKLVLSGTVLGEGALQLIDGNWFYRKTDLAVGHTPTLATKTVAYQSNGATVTHTYTGLLSATVVYTYVVSDNDIHISAHVTNNHATKPLQPAFRSMRILRNGTAGTYIGLGFDQSSTQNNNTISYPSVNVPLGASVMSVPSTPGPTINLAVWSEEHPTEKFMSLLFGVFPNPGVAIGSIFFNTVPPGGSRIYKWAFRFQNSTDWKDLLLGYKTHLRTVFPNVAYEPDARPVLQFARIHTSYVRPDNPYGYQDGGNGISSRFDKIEGCQDYLSKTIPQMVDVNYQGIIFWQLQGIHPRGAQYRPDFNVFPPETIPNLPTLTSGYNSVGLNIGLLSRPKVSITSATWTTDGFARITDFPESVLDVTARFQWALINNFKGFYLDSFVSDGPDHGILKAIRDTLGTIMHTFCENSTALSLAYSGDYIEINWNGNVITLSQIQQILRWLWPESIVLAKFIGPLPSTLEGYTQLYTAMFDLKLTPLVQDFELTTNRGNNNTVLKSFVANRIGADKRWL